MVWRISEQSTQGEWVSKDAPVAKPRLTDPAESWSASSFDLLRGAETTDLSDSVTGELFDELFPDPNAPSKDNKQG